MYLFINHQGCLWKDKLENLQEHLKYCFFNEISQQELYLSFTSKELEITSLSFSIILKEDENKENLSTNCGQITIRVFIYVIVVTKYTKK